MKELDKLLRDIEYELEMECHTDYYHPGRVDSNDLTELKKEMCEYMLRIVQYIKRREIGV